MLPQVPEAFCDSRRNQGGAMQEDDMEVPGITRYNHGCYNH